jgi:hypothetical protein
VIKISADAIGFPTPEMQEQVQGLSHLDLVISQMPTIVLQGLQMGIMQEL